MFPGLVQTVAYARALLVSPLASAMNITEADADALVAERVKRQDILYQPGRALQVVVGEAALWNTPGTVDVQVAQLDRLISFIALPSLEFGVVPHGVPMPIAPIACFSVHDDNFVLVETLTGEQRLDDPDEVAVYVKAFDLLREAAATGPDAMELIQRVAASLR